MICERGIVSIVSAVSQIMGGTSIWVPVWELMCRSVIQVLSMIGLAEYRGVITRIYENVFRKWARDIDNFHRSTHSIRIPQ